jgi:hypothetical protein
MAYSGEAQKDIELDVVAVAALPSVHLPAAHWWGYVGAAEHRRIGGRQVSIVRRLSGLGLRDPAAHLPGRESGVSRPAPVVTAMLARLSAKRGCYVPPPGDQIGLDQAPRLRLSQAR